jgi:hypothetical protein
MPSLVFSDFGINGYRAYSQNARGVKFKEMKRRIAEADILPPSHVAALEQ